MRPQTLLPAAQDFRMDAVSVIRDVQARLEPESPAALLLDQAQEALARQGRVLGRLERRRDST